MITGAHSIIYSKDAEADRTFLRDTIGFSGVDVGGGWLVFALLPAEVAVHPAENNGTHEFFLICDDIRDFIRSMNEKSVPCTDIHKEPWGLFVDITLPGGGKLGVYEALHERPSANDT